ncbi:MAG: histidinol dehydrogenase [Dokdonella sp.]
MKILTWNALDSVQQVDALRRPAQANAADTRESVARTIADVRERGDAALLELTARFDGCTLDTVRVDDAEFAAAEAALSEKLKAAIKAARARIDAFHRAGAVQPYRVETAPGVICERLLRAITRVGLYVPAGGAPLPSTALMLGVPAQIAGCRNVVLCTPPRSDGRCDEAVLYAARLCGIQTVFKIGGAQAIAAMAYGTESVPRCDKLFGPGNVWVTEAKLQAAADPDGAAADMPAGPSEVMVIADASADARFVAADLLAQAEHGADSQVLLVTDSAELIYRVQREVDNQCEGLSRRELVARALQHARLIRVDSLADAASVSNAYAPEHLILNVEQPRSLLDAIESAGSIFLGAWSPESVGDYCSGTNHVLPTYGAARAWSGLSVASFQKQITVQELSIAGLREIGECTMTLASAERLDAHARAVGVRLEALEDAA